MSHLSVGLSSAFFICARFAAQLDWCSAFGWWVFCLGVGGFCLEKSFKWGVKLWGEERLHKERLAQIDWLGSCYQALEDGLA